MARYTDSVCRQCRRENQKLFLKGDKCYSEKCCVSRRPYPPGQHGQGRKKPSEYGIQLREKQKARRYYGVLEGQFRKYFNMATAMGGQTGVNLLSLLERRLDNVVYRMGYAMSRPEARQLVSHGHFMVDGRRVTVPSFLVKPGMVVAVRQKSRTLEKFKFLFEANASHPVPNWISPDRDKHQASITALPTREDVDFPIEEQMIVELYSK
ncbi:MAG: 30S ribosomal protein S4 [Oscillospiraceae bacterium]|nr:30S ribosomal protein S4 [Oscillospiraceae bacterium]